MMASPFMDRPRQVPSLHHSGFAKAKCPKDGDFLYYSYLGIDTARSGHLSLIIQILMNIHWHQVHSNSVRTIVLRPSKVDHDIIETKSFYTELFIPTALFCFIMARSAFPSQACNPGLVKLVTLCSAQRRQSGVK